MKRVLLVATVSLFFLSGVFAQIVWVQKANVGNQPRSSSAAFSLGGYGYVGTGDNQVWNNLNDFWKYDSGTNSWTQKSNVAGAIRKACVGFSIGNYGYIGLGFNNTIYYSELWEYNATSDTWSQKANFPGVSRSYAAGVSDGAYGYIGLGQNGSTYYKDFWQYDPAANTWTAKSDFPGGPREGTVRFSINGKVYIGCGYDGTSNYADLWEFDPASGAWAMRADFPGSIRSNTVSLSVGSFGYAGLGSTSNNPYYNDFWRYDGLADTWTAEANFPGIATVDGIAFSIGDTGYVGTGYNGSLSTQYYNQFYAFYQGSLPLASFSPSDTTFCGESGGCIDFNDFSGGHPTSWKWYFPGAIPDTSTQQNPKNICYYNPGTYAVTLVITNGSGSDSVTVSPMVRFSSPILPIVTRKADTLLSSHACGYQWYFNGVPISGATDSFYVAHQYGVYAVYVQDCFGCSIISQGILASVNDLSSSTFIHIYPNPSHNKFTITFSKLMSNASLKMFNVMGEEVNAVAVGSSTKQEIQTGNLAKGIYFVHITNNERQYVQKIVIE